MLFHHEKNKKGELCSATNSKSNSKDAENFIKPLIISVKNIVVAFLSVILFKSVGLSQSSSVTYSAKGNENANSIIILDKSQQKVY